MQCFLVITNEFHVVNLAKLYSSSSCFDQASSHVDAFLFQSILLLHSPFWFSMRRDTYFHTSTPFRRTLNRECCKGN